MFFGYIIGEFFISATVLEHSLSSSQKILLFNHHFVGGIFSIQAFRVVFKSLLIYLSGNAFDTWFSRFLKYSSTFRAVNKNNRDSTKHPLTVCARLSLLLTICLISIKGSNIILMSSYSLFECVELWNKCAIQEERRC